MNCSYCGAKADYKEVYCLVCGRKLTSGEEKIQKNASFQFKQSILQQTIDPITPKAEKEFPRTHAVLEEIFGSKETLGDKQTFDTKDIFGEKETFDPKDIFGEKDAFDVKDIFGEKQLFDPKEILGAKEAFDPKNIFGEKDIFGTKEDWEIPAKNPLPEIEEDYRFPVTPCADWPVEEETDEKDSFPVYTTAPLRQDVQPMAASMPEIPELVFESMLKLPVSRSMMKMVLFGLLTLGIYPTVIWSRIVTEMNIVASRSDGKRTMPYFGMLLLAPVTLGVFPFVWMHRFCNRVGKHLEYRECDFRFSAKDFWLWGVLGSLILVGPFIFTHKMMNSMNLINKHFNKFGG